MRHDIYGSHLHQAAGNEVLQFLILSFFDGICAGLELARHLFHAVHEFLHFGGTRDSLVVVERGGVSPVRNVADSGNRL